ncbi:hypothetical protein BCR32DRAFT_210914, partial [Anaeromyces robustus]
NINLSHRNLTEIPPDIFIMYQLEEIDISNNQLTEITPFISKIISLKKLNIKNNKLKSLPISLWDLPELEELIMDGNLLPCLPSEVKSDNTFVKPIKSFLISGRNRLPISDNKIKEIFGICKVNLKKNIISLIT